MLSDIQCKDGQGIFIRDNGYKVDETLIEEIDDLIRNTLEDCEDYENKDIKIEYENIGEVLRDSFNKHLLQKNDSEAIKTIKKEIFDWNVRFLVIDNACFTIDELSTKYWGKFKVNTRKVIIIYDKFFKYILLDNIKLYVFIVCWWSRTSFV